MLNNSFLFKKLVFLLFFTTNALFCTRFVIDDRVERWWKNPNRAFWESLIERKHDHCFDYFPLNNELQSQADQIDVINDYLRENKISELEKTWNLSSRKGFQNKKQQTIAFHSVPREVIEKYINDPKAIKIWIDDRNNNKKYYKEPDSNQRFSDIEYFIPVLTSGNEGNSDPAFSLHYIFFKLARKKTRDGEVFFLLFHASIHSYDENDVKSMNVNKHVRSLMDPIFKEMLTLVKKEDTQGSFFKSVDEKNNRIFYVLDQKEDTINLEEKPLKSVEKEEILCNKVHQNSVNILKRKHENEQENVFNKKQKLN